MSKDLKKLIKDNGATVFFIVIKQGDKESYGTEHIKKLAYNKAL